MRIGSVPHSSQPRRPLHDILVDQLRSIKSVLGGNQGVLLTNNQVSRDLSQEIRGILSQRIHLNIITYPILKQVLQQLESLHFSGSDSRIKLNSQVRHLRVWCQDALHQFEQKQKQKLIEELNDRINKEKIQDVNSEKRYTSTVTLPTETLLYSQLHFHPIDKPIEVAKSKKAITLTNLSVFMTHFFGDGFALDTYLEGSSPGLIKKTLVELLDNITVSETTGNLFMDLIKALEKGKELEEILLDPQQQGDVIRDKLNSLDVNQRLILNFGWLGTPGHATYLEVMRLSNNTFQIRHFNLGAGCDRNQAKRWDEASNRFVYIPFSLHENVPIENFCHPAFKQGYIELQIIGKRVGSETFGVSHMDALLAFLGPSSPISLPVDKYQSPQHSGVCAWYSLNALIRHSLSHEEYAQFYLQVGFQVIQTFHDYLKTKNQLHSLPNLEVFNLCMKSFLLQTSMFNTFYSDTDKNQIKHVANLLQDNEAKWKELTDYRIQNLIPNQPFSPSSENLLCNSREIDRLLSFTPLPPVAPRYKAHVVDFPRSFERIEEVQTFLQQVYKECEKTFVENKTKVGYTRVLTLGNLALQTLPLTSRLWNNAPNIEVLGIADRLILLMRRAVVADGEVTHPTYCDLILSQMAMLGIAIQIIQASIKNRSHDDVLKNWANCIGVDFTPFTVFFDPTQQKGDANLYPRSQYQLFKKIIDLFTNWDARDQRSNKINHWPICITEEQYNDPNPDPLIQLLKEISRKPSYIPYEVSKLLSYQPGKVSLLPTEMLVLLKFIGYCDTALKNSTWTKDIHDYSKEHLGFFANADQNKCSQKFYLGETSTETPKSIQHPLGLLDATPHFKSLINDYGPLNTHGRALEKIRFQEPVSEAQGISKKDFTQLKELFSYYSKSDPLFHQLINGVDFFMQRQDLLMSHAQKPYFQEFFKWFLLRLLHKDAVAFSPELNTRLSEFLTQSFKDTLAEKNFQTASFFLKLRLYVQPRLMILENPRYEIWLTPSIEDTPIKDAYLNDIDTFLQTEGSADVHPLLHHLRVAFYGQYPGCLLFENKKTFIQFLKSQSEIASTSGTLQGGDSALHFLCSRAFECSTLVVSANLKAFKVNVLNALVPTDNQGDWALDSDCWVANQGDYKFDFHTGILSHQEKRLGIPDTLLADVAFNRFFSKEEQKTLSFEEKNEFFLFDWGTTRLRFRKNKCNTFDVFLARGGELFQYEPKEKWNDPFIKFASKPLLEETLVFIRKYRSNNTVHKDGAILFYSSQNKHLVASADLRRTTDDSGDTALVAENLVRINDQKIKLSLKETSFDWLLYCDEDAWISCYGRRLCDEINLPRLGLSFKRDSDKNVFMCVGPEELNGYWVDAHYARGFSGFNHYMRLTNGEDSKVLIPAKKIEKKRWPKALEDIRRPEGRRLFGREYTQTDFVFEKKPYFLYPTSVLEEAYLNSTSVSKNEDLLKNLYVIYAMLSIGNFSRAFRLADALLTNPYPPSEMAIEFIKNEIFSVSKTNSSVQEAAAYLKVLSKYISYLDCEYINKERGFLDTYTTYLDLHQSVVECRLSYEEEKKIIRFFTQAGLQNDALDMRHVTLGITDNDALYSLDPIDPKPCPPVFPLSQEVRKSLTKIFGFYVMNTSDFPSHIFQSISSSRDFNAYYAALKDPNSKNHDFAKGAIRILSRAYPQNPYVVILVAVSDEPDRFPSVDRSFAISNLIHKTLEIDDEKKALSNESKPSSVLSSSHAGFIPKSPQSQAKGTILSQPQNSNYTDLTKELSKNLKSAIGKLEFVTIENHDRPMTYVPESLCADRQVFIAYKNQQSCLLTSVFQESDSPNAQALFEKMERSCTVEKVVYGKLMHQYGAQALNLMRKATSDSALKQQAGLAVCASMNDLTRAFVYQNTEAYRRFQPDLTDAQCQDLHNLVFHYVQCSRHSNRCDRVKTLILKLKTLDEQKKAEKQQLVQELVNELNDALKTENPERMVFEHRTKMGLRPLQNNTLDSLGDPDKANQKIIQMSMGKGKTSVILPLLSFKKANGDNLAVVIATESQINDVVNDLHGKSAEIFGQRVEFFELNRNTPLDVFSADEIFRRFESCRQDRGVLVGTSKSFHCLRLKFQELYFGLYCLEPTSNKFKKQKSMCESLKNSLLLLRDKGDVTLDEADVLLNCKNEVNFTLGDLAKPDPSHIDMLVKLHRYVGHEQKHNSFITKATFQTHIHKAVCDALDNNTLDLGQHFSTLLAKNKDQVIGFLKLERSELNGEFTENEKDLLFLCRQELIDLLDITYQKENFVSYGPDKDYKKSIQALPYVANNQQSKTSAFDHIHEILNYTIQMYQEIGVPKWIVKDHVDALRHDLLVELDLSLQFEETVVYSQFKSFFPSLNPRLLLDDTQLEGLADEIVAELKANKTLLDQYLSDYVLRVIGTATSSLNSSSFDLASMFSRVQGFTGTPWNSDSFPFQIDTTIDHAMEGESAYLLLDRPVAITVLNKNQCGSMDALVRAFELKPNTRALIDAGALFKGADNEEVAKQLLLRFTGESFPIKAIVFYYGNQKSYLINEGSTFSIKPYDGKLVPMIDCFTLYDHHHIFGADIKQIQNAEAVVTVGKNLNRRDLFQAMWRMRELDKGQSIALLVSPEVQQIVNDVSINSLLDFVETNLKKLLQKHVIQSADMQFDHIKEDQAFLNLLKDPIETKESPGNIFIRKRSIDPQEMYKTISGTIQKSNFIESKKGLISSNSAYKKALAKVEKVLPDSFSYPVRQEGVETEMEQEQEQECEIEKEKEVETSRENFIDRGSLFKYKTLFNLKFDSADDLIHSKIRAALDFEAPLNTILTPSEFDWLRSRISEIAECHDVQISDSNLPIKTLVYAVSIPKMFPLTEKKETILMQDIYWSKHIHSESYLMKDPTTPSAIKSEFQLDLSYILVNQNGMFVLHECDLEDIMTSFDPYIGPHSGAIGIFHVSDHAVSPVHLRGMSLEDLNRAENRLKLLKIRLYNGVISFSESDYELLKTWLDTPEKKREVLTTLENDILIWKPDRLKGFQHSKLKRVLDCSLT